VSGKVSTLVCNRRRELFRAQRLQNVIGNEQARTNRTNNRDDRKRVLQDKRGNADRFEFDLRGICEPVFE